eukprot:gene5859-9057_t
MTQPPAKKLPPVLHNNAQYHHRERSPHHWCLLVSGIVKFAATTTTTATAAAAAAKCATSSSEPTSPRTPVDTSTVDIFHTHISTTHVKLKYGKMFLSAIVRFGVRQMPAPQLARPIRSLTSRTREGWIMVEETGESKFQNRVSDGRHETLADEPGSFEGGMDTGMNPYGFLLAAIGTCTNMTMRMFAVREGIPLRKSRVYVKHDRIWGKDCDECKSSSGRVDVIDMEIVLEGDQLTEAQRAKLMDVANRCPVHKTLTTETLVHVKSAN